MTQVMLMIRVMLTAEEKCKNKKKRPPQPRPATRPSPHLHSVLLCSVGRVQPSSFTQTAAARYLLAHALARRRLAECSNSCPGVGVVQTGPAEMSVYMNADYAQPSAHLRRFSMRLDGFASMHAGAERGAWTTKPLVFEGERLELRR